MKLRWSLRLDLAQQINISVHDLLLGLEDSDRAGLLKDSLADFIMFQFGFQKFLSAAAQRFWRRRNQPANYGLGAVAGNDLLLYEFGELAESELQLGSVVEVLAACLAHLPVIARTAHRSFI